MASWHVYLRMHLDVFWVFLFAFLVLLTKINSEGLPCGSISSLNVLGRTGYGFERLSVSKQIDHQLLYLMLHLMHYKRRTRRS